jgi:pSer/pThr/pTyr-binding forkhead associated (FHA) protein
MKLIIEDDQGQRTAVPLLRGELTIGRAEQNAVRLTEKNVSRRHARVVRENGTVFIEDLGSFTGVSVNGTRVQGRVELHDGDRIRIAEYDLSLDPAPSEEEERAARKEAETAVVRLSDLGAHGGAEAAPVEIPPEKRPKLVGLSGTFRGKELSLHKSPIRIGRSEGNDLEIDHPSVSRNQCRLWLDNRIWKVLDAESRNGVRVNGEPYAAIGLRHGDVLEIGHVRFAFVSPGHVYKLPPEVVTPIPQAMVAASPHRRLWIAMGAIAVALLVAGALIALRRAGSGDSADAKAERKFALRAADEAAAAHRYAEAVRGLETARRAGATAAELRNLEALRAEAQAEELYRDLEAAASSQDWERARKLLADLGDSQAYYGRKAAEKAEAITSGYVNLHVAAAALMKGKDNPGCLAEANLALQANPNSADALALAEACRLSGGTRVQASSIGGAPQRPAAGDDALAKKWVTEGNQKVAAQDFAGAVTAYQKALAAKPSAAVLGVVYRGMGIAYTRQGDIENGARYYKLYLPLCTDARERDQVRKMVDDYEARRRK